MAKSKRKARRSKRVELATVYSETDWRVSVGELKPTARGGRKPDFLFKFVPEKLPWGSLPQVGSYLKKLGVKRETARST
jgi:hypothetical protein